MTQQTARESIRLAAIGVGKEKKGSKAEGRDIVRRKRGAYHVISEQRVWQRRKGKQWWILKTFREILEHEDTR